MGKLKNEALFRHFDDQNVPPTDSGRAQFEAHQSRGVKPTNPDPFYVALTRGKAAFDYLTREYQQMFVGTRDPVTGRWRESEWWGFRQLWVDWTGKRWILGHLCKWYERVRPLPRWLTREDATEADIEAHVLKGQA